MELDDLPPAWKEQAIRQMSRNENRPAEPKKPGKRQPPKSERDYYVHNILPKVASGEIVKVEEQRRFELLPAEEYCGIRLPAAHYTPDFILIHRDGTVEVVEVKSKFTRKAQRDYIYRRRLFIDKYARPGGWIFTEYIVEAKHD